jgi:hypothetical protein
MSTGEPGARVQDSELEYDGELSYRWHGALFTRVGFDEAKDGSRSEVSYRYGVQNGPARDWYPSGALKGDSWFRDNVRHGNTREYDESGDLLCEVSYEYGMAVVKSERDESGRMVETTWSGRNDRNLWPTASCDAICDQYRVVV